MSKTAFLKEYLIKSDGRVIDKDNPNTTLNDLLIAEHELRIIPDESNPNSLGFPTLDEYLSRESSIGSSIIHIGVNSIETSTNSGGTKFDYTLNFELS